MLLEREKPLEPKLEPEPDCASFWAPLAPENRLMPRYCAKLKNEIAAMLEMR